MYFLGLHSVYMSRDTTALIRAFLRDNHVDFRYTLPRILCNADNKSSGNKGTQHEPARLIVCDIFLRKQLTLSSVDLE